jgi:peptidoglycan hydrolase-like protein with peptidoglycan-binding domain
MRNRTTFALTICAVLTTASLAFATEPATDAKPAAKPAVAGAMHHKGMVHHARLSKDDAIAVQNALVKAGNFKGTADGVMGATTVDALKAFQKANSLKVTGWADDATLAKLGVTRTPPATTAATTAPATSKTPR